VAIALITVVKGDIDGVNRDFITPDPYQTGTLRAFLNGCVHRAEDNDGWEETSSTGFRMKSAPVTGDTVSAYYVPL